MKIYYFFLLLTLIHVSCNEEELAYKKAKDIETHDFQKDIEELDLSGLEEDITSIQDIAYDNNFVYTTQIYVYVRIDNEYNKYLTHLNFIKLGEIYMSELDGAMLPVQLKKTGAGIYTCFYQNKEITENLANYFLARKEIDFIKVDFDYKYPEGRNTPITSVELRGELEPQTSDEL
ncbi:conserved protein, unknown function [Hepatocystis sp. ex Piliocolobus tephrosceles]|nr:conserved protein, unknown function [Hepatocystis sp. ex Piliocolobus tephrosceles]